MKTYEAVDNEDLGTVFLQGKSGKNASGVDGGKTYLRKIITEYKQFDPPRTGIFFIRELNMSDLAYIEVDGNDFLLDFEKTANRTYQLVLIGKKKTTITVPKVAIVTGYPWGEDAHIQVDEGEVVALKLTQTFLGNATKWLVEVDGETDGVATGVRLSAAGEIYLPNDDGTITIPVVDLLREVEEACKEYADKQVADVTLYWND